ncbi:MAG: DUF1576 domain-containing protein [Ruminococcaceae bacterium]|nr:DUF1576 domain-containing protein [Oscillospiraceae bacterium]
MKRNKATKQIACIMLGYSIAAIITGLLVGDISETLKGFWTILTSPAQLTIDYFKLGTVGAAYLNSGLVGLGCVAVLWLSKLRLNGTSLMAFFLCIGFSFYGINFMNIWPCIFGTWLYTRFAKVKFYTQVNIALFSTCMAPFVSEMICRYPVFDGLAYAWVFKILAGILVGIFAGIMMALLCPHGPNLHKGYSLYNAAMVGGFIAIFLFSLLFKATGVEIPVNTDLGEGETMIVNAFAIGTAVIAIIAGFFMNGRSFKGYGEVIASTGYKCDFTQSAGVPLTLVNIGVFGLFVTAYYNIVGANFTGPTQGCLICLLAVAACGAHAFNMLPIMIGYAIASTFCTFELSTQSIIIGLCYAGAMIPISGRFGSLSGIIAGIVHAILVTNVVTFHGGFLLYNGGFTSGIVAIILIPVLEYFFQPSDKLRLLPMKK